MTRGSRTETLYMGFDIESGEPGSARARYSVAVVDSDGLLVDKSSGATLSRLIRMAWEYRPVAIGTDNIYELAQDVRGIIRILNLLPPETKIVQVNILDGKVLELREAAKRAGLELDQQKLTPSKTAYLVALMASRGIGSPVYVQEEKTIITVSRGRWSKSGGMSQARFQRRIRASVLQAARRIQEALDRAGLDYDVYYKRSRGGIDRAVFTVYAPRSKLVGIVRPHRGIDYVVTLKTIYKRALVFGEESVPSTRPVIVGIDPGIRAGLAVIDLDGNTLHISSRKGLDRKALVEEISRYGRPVIIAVDTPDVPETVKAVAAKFNASIYKPGRPMPVPEKVELAKAALQGVTPTDPHERDALAAAYKAYVSLQSKLRQVEAYLAKINVDLDFDKVKEYVLRGMSLAEAVELELQRILEDTGAHGVREQRLHQRDQSVRALAEEARALRDRIEELNAKLILMDEKVKILQAELERTQVELEQCRRSRARPREPDVSRYIERIASLEQRLDELKSLLEGKEEALRKTLEELVRVSRGERIVVRELPSLTLSSIRKSEKSQGPILPGEVVYVSNPGTYETEAIEDIKRKGVVALLLDDASKGLGEAARRRGLPALGIMSYNPSRVDRLLLVDSRVKVDAERILEEIERERRANIRLERLIEEYRRERLEELRRQEHSRRKIKSDNHS